ncbi:MAG: hypothetical protein ACU0AT_13755 [Tranquillimonas sp.]
MSAPLIHKARVRRRLALLVLEDRARRPLMLRERIRPPRLNHAVAQRLMSAPLLSFAPG